MEVRPGYKLTELGVIPEEWEIQACSEVSERIMVGIVIRPKQYYVSHGVPAFRSANIREDGITDSDLVFISDSSNTLLAKSQTRTGDILTVRTGYPGTSAVVRPAHAGCNCIDILITRPSKKVASDFLAIWINSSFGKEQVLRNQGGLAQKHFNVGDMRNLLVAVPTLAEQRAIAAALGDVDALLSALGQLIAKNRNLKQAALQQFLTGRIRLPGFHREWDDIELGDIVTIRNAKIVASSTPAGTRCVELECIGQGTGRLLGSVDAIGLSAKYSFKKGDVLFGRLRAYLKKYWLATFDGICSTEIWPLIPCSDRLCSSFLHLLVQTSEFVDAADVSYGTHMPRSDWSVLRKLAVHVPPLPEQTAIAVVLSDMDAELSALEARRDKTRALKQAMMQELLTGRTRLV